MASRFSLFLAELKRRRVYRVATVYVVVGAGILGLCEAALPSDTWQTLQIPVGVILLVGFPVALVLAWAYEVRPEEPQIGSFAAHPSPSEPQPGRPASDVSAASHRSIAVLPFSDMSPGGDQEYFCDGVAEEILNVLTRIPDLRVAARTSSFSYKDKRCDIKEIGKDLGVATVLEGSVRKAGDRLRVTAQLTEVSGGFHLWSETYEQKQEDVFAIQDDIARAIAGVLRVTLLGEVKESLVRTGTDNAQAYDLYLRGRHRWVRRYKYGLQTALEYFQKAVEADPEYALPHTGIADVHVILAIYGLLNAEDAGRIAKEAVDQALALDPQLPEAYFSQGNFRGVFHYDWNGASRLLKHALELKPDFAAAHIWIALGLVLEGERIEEGLEHARAACALEPHSPHTPYIQDVAGNVFTMAGRYGEALGHFQRALELEPEDVMALYGAGNCLSALGRHPEALAALEKAAGLSHRMPWVLGLVCAAFRRAGRTSAAQAILEELKARATEEYVPPVAMAVACANVDRVDDAFRYLEQAVEEAKPSLTNIIRSPVWDAIQSDPRYIGVLKRMGIKPWYPSSAC